MNSTWQIRKLIIVHLLLFILFLFWLCPITWSWIHLLDVKAAYFFNSFILKSRFWQNFWAYCNSSIMDWYYDGIIFTFCLVYICTKSDLTRKQRIIQCIVLILFAMACFLSVHRGIVKKLTRPVRLSPTGHLNDLFHLSSVISWTNVKIFSKHSFPSDHGYTIFMFILSCFFMNKKRLGMIATLVSIPFLLPRLITGAHWLTDLLLGALPVALFNLSWLFYTPAFDRLTNLFSSRGEKACLE